MHPDAWLVVIDPLLAARLHPNDKRRIIRGLEVFKLTGQRLSHLQTQFDEAQPVTAAKVFVLSWQRDVLGIVDGRRFGPRAGTQVENLFHEINQIVHAKVVDCVLQSREQAEISAKPDDVPGIHQRAALDAPLDQVLDLRNVFGHGAQLM